MKWIKWIHYKLETVKWRLFTLIIPLTAVLIGTVGIWLHTLLNFTIGPYVFISSIWYYISIHRLFFHISE
jgi:hypothetical protein